MQTIETEIRINDSLLLVVDIDYSYYPPTCNSKWDAPSDLDYTGYYELEDWKFKELWDENGMIGFENLPDAFTQNLYGEIDNALDKYLESL